MLGWQAGVKVHTLAFKPNDLGLNPNPAINCHHGQGESSERVPSLGWTLNGMVLSAGIKWWALKILRCPS